MEGAPGVGDGGTESDAPFGGMTCCATVSGSFVGVRRFLVAFRYENALSGWEGEGFSIGGMECERAGETHLAALSNARTFTSVRRRPSASWVIIRSASRRERVNAQGRVRPLVQVLCPWVSQKRRGYPRC